MPGVVVQGSKYLTSTLFSRASLKPNRACENVVRLIYISIPISMIRGISIIRAIHKSN